MYYYCCTAWYQYVLLLYWMEHIYVCIHTYVPSSATIIHICEYTKECKGHKKITKNRRPKTSRAAVRVSEGQTEMKSEIFNDHNDRIYIQCMRNKQIVSSDQWRRVDRAQTR